MKISIITVAFNSGLTIKDTFDSIRSQDYDNIEYIVIDGNSSDETVDLIKSNEDIIHKWISENDKGIYDAMNKGISLATGDIVGILNSDDVYFEPQSISLVMNEFLNKENDIVYGNINYVSKDLSNIIRKWRSSKYKLGRFKYGWHPPHPSFFVKKNLYTKYGTYDLDLSVAADFDVMLRFLEKHKAKSKFIDRVITKMRIGGESNRSIKNILMGRKNIKDSFIKNNIKPYPLYTFFRFLPKFFEFFK